MVGTHIGKRTAACCGWRHGFDFIKTNAAGLHNDQPFSANLVLTRS